MNKPAEREIVDKVYTLKRDWAIEASESPDFLCMAEGKPILGIEVTGYHHSETHARLRHMENYVLDLLDGKPIRHKDDKTLKISEIEIQDRDGKSKQKSLKAVIQEIPSIERRIELLSEIVERKSQKCPIYLANTPDVDLLIDDREHGFWFKDFSSLYHSLLTNQRCRKALTVTKFREIILATTTPGEDGKKRVSIPLRANMIVEHVQIFAQLFTEFSEQHGIKNDYEPFCSILAACLTNLGYGNARIELAPGILSIQFASIEMRLSDADGVVVRDHLCLPNLQGQGETASARTHHISNDFIQFASYLLAERQKLICSVPLHFPIT